MTNFSMADELAHSAIKKSEAPFLGLLSDSLPDAAHEVVQLGVQAHTSIGGYCKLLERFPALFAIHLASHVMRGLGQSGHFEVYSHIQRATGAVGTLSQPQREELWKAFRLAILRLGLAPASRTSGPHYMADEYVRQAGVPLAFVDSLAEQMLKFARRVGLPDEDDPEAIVAWQAALDAHLKPPFSATARKTLQLDSNGFYTRCFLRVRRLDGCVPGDASSIEKAMAGAFLQQGVRTAYRRTTLPYVLLNDGVLGVFIPAGEDREQTIVVDGQSHRYRVGAEDRFVPFAELLPKKVCVSVGFTAGSDERALWEDNASNRILVFSDNGRLRGRGRLGQTEPINLSPGRYRVLSRFEPRDLPAELLWETPSVYAFDVDLGPGSTVDVKHGPARLSLCGDEEPFARWEGPVAATKERVQFHYGSTNIQINIPESWVHITGRSFIVRLSPGVLGAPVDVDVELDERGVASVDVARGATSGNWKPGFARLQLELRRNGEARVILHSSVLYWHGLNRLTQALRFDCEKAPANLKLSLCQNVIATGESLAVAESLQRVVRLVFDLGDERHQALTWNRPGTFLEVETFDEQGRSTRIARPLESTESVSLVSNKQVIVFSSEPGTLRLGEWVQHVDFARAPSKVLPAAFLASRIAPGSNVLSFQGDQSSVVLPLLKLQQPRNVERLQARMHDGQLQVCFQLHDELQAVTVRGTEVTSGQTFSIEVAADNADWTGFPFGRTRLMTERVAAGGFKASLYLFPEELPSGAWLLTFEGCVHETWGHLENLRQDRYAAGLLWRESEGVLRTPEYVRSLNELGDTDSLRALANCNEALQVCFAEDSWLDVRWLDDAWAALVKRWGGREEEEITALSNIAMARPPEGLASSWLPMRSLCSRLPRLFALQGVAYARVNSRPLPISLALRAIYLVGEKYPGIYPDPIHLSAAGGFANFAAMQRGAVPSGFDIQRYEHVDAWA